MTGTTIFRQARREFHTRGECAQGSGWWPVRQRIPGRFASLERAGSFIAVFAAGREPAEPQLAKIALDLETVAASLATAQRTCDADIAAPDNFLRGIDDAIGAAEAAKQDTQELHKVAVAAVRTTLGEVQGSRDGYAATMTSAESAMAAVAGEAPPGAGGAPASPSAEADLSGLALTKKDLAIGAAGVVAGGTADGVDQATLKLIMESPGTGPGRPTQVC